MVINTLRLRQNGSHFPDDIFKWIFLNENVWILIKISFKFGPKVPINNNSAFVKIMAWRQSGYKPLSEPMLVSLLTYICVTWPQWIKILVSNGSDNGLVPEDHCHQSHCKFLRIYARYSGINLSFFLISKYLAREQWVNTSYHFMQISVAMLWDCACFL